MPRPNAPWFRKSKNTWYATIDGRKVSLGVRGKRSRRDALLAFAKLINGNAPQPAKRSPTVRELVEKYLATAPQRVGAATLARYRYDAGEFVKALGTMRADRLTSCDVAGWVHGLQVSDTTKAIMLRSVSAVLGWAVRAKLIPENPARGIPRPKVRSRSAAAIISESDHARMLAVATPGFQLVLRVLYATGCRPGEVSRITAENYDRENGVAVLAEHKTDRTGRSRLIYFPPDLANELGIMAERYRTGPLLRSRKGKPWTGKAITQAVRRVRLKSGVRAIAYGYRHTFATDALANGVPEAHVAELLGHSGTAVLHRHYSHLGSKGTTLRAALGKVREG